MPTVMLDGHTYEGKKANVPVTLLSGHYHDHLALSKLVAADGWQTFRQNAHAGTVAGKPLARQNTLFCFRGLLQHPPGRFLLACITYQGDNLEVANEIVMPIAVLSGPAVALASVTAGV